MTKPEGGSWTASVLGWGLLFLALPAEAATYYVSPGESLSAAIARLQPGDTLYLRGGVYGQLVYGTTIPSGTSWDNPVTIASVPGETAIIRPPWSAEAFYIWGTSYVILDRLVFDGSNQTDDAFLAEIGCDFDRAKGEWLPETCAHHIRIQNSEFKHAGGTALGTSKGSEGNTNQGNNEVINNAFHHSNLFTACSEAEALYIGSSRDLFRGNVFYDNDGAAINLCSNGGTFTINDSIIEQNVFHDNGGRCGATAVPVQNGHRILIRNNLFYNEGVGPAISIFHGSSETSIYHNTFYQTGGYGYGTLGGAIWIGAGISGTVIKNNIFYQNRIAAVGDEGTGTVLANNFVVGEDVNPLFANLSAHDFHLQATSPAIDAGVTLAEVPTDFEGTPRPQGAGYDIGAYEYRASAGLRGDLDGNGKRDLVDVRLMIYMLLGQQPKTPEAELTGEGAVTLADVQALIRLLVGL